MRRWMLLLLCTAWALAGCAVAPVVAPPGEEIFRDDLFAPAAPLPDRGALFALSAEMKHYLRERIEPQVRRKGPQQALVDALYTQGELKLEYDAQRTRTAAEAFDARMGNCLSLVVMTAAFAQELGLRVRFQEVPGAPAVERSGDLTFLVGHVNLALGSGFELGRSSLGERNWLVIDFLPGQDLRGQRTLERDEARIRAMFMNNRAAEETARGRLREAYWWARAAWSEDRRFAHVYNTLGVIYSRAGAMADAERVLRVARALDPYSDHVAENLAGVLRAQGQEAEASRLAAARPAGPPLPLRWDRARQAIEQGSPKQAVAMLQGELGLTPRNAELHYWMAIAYGRIGDARRAQLHLEKAAEYSASGEQRQLYAGKLERLKAQMH